MNARSPAHPLHYLPPGTRSFLDVGCNEGASIQYAGELGVEKLCGIEISENAVAIARKRVADAGFSADIRQGSADELPWKTGSFDFALCSEVLEHVPAGLRKTAATEMIRVLKPGGTLVLTVPAAGLFAALDPANFRFRFPAIYQAGSRLVGGRGREAGFEKQKHGVVWHHHFSLRELREHLEPGLRIESIRWRGSLIAPLCNWAEFPFYRRQAHDHWLLKSIQKLAAWEMEKQLGAALAYNVLVVARKP